MSRRGLSCTAWHRTLWQRIADAFPPPKQRLAMVLSYLLVVVPAAIGAGVVLADWLVAP